MYSQNFHLDVVIREGDLDVWEKYIMPILGVLTFLLAFNIPRLFELTFVTKCNEYLGVDLPVQVTGWKWF